MAHLWSGSAKLTGQRSTASAWASEPQPEHVQVHVHGHQGAWAGAAETHASSSSAWAGQPFFDGDSDADDVDPMPVEHVVGAAVVDISSIQSTIALIEATTPLAKINTLTKQLTQLLQESKNASEVGACALVFHNLLQKNADHGQQNDFLKDKFETDGIHTFVEEQLTTSDGYTSKALESHTAENQRLKCSKYKVKVKRELMSVGAYALQRGCAETFLDSCCNKVEAVNGCSMTYFEKHRGDETPFTRVSATDLTEDQAAKAISDLPSEAVVPVANDVSTIAKPEESLQARSVTTNLKVYSTDVEIGALYIMHDQELLVTFKLVNPLSRLDRCTGVNYKWLHRKFSWILEARRRFKRCQRLHTSDGDKAQDLAERILSHENAGKENCPVPTLRNRCQVHRVYHCITHGMLQAEAFISGQVKLALSLKGAWPLHEV